MDVRHLGLQLVISIQDPKKLTRETSKVRDIREVNLQISSFQSASWCPNPPHVHPKAPPLLSN